MKIALLFNQKPDPKAGAGTSVDTYCEWDTPETIRAVADALRARHDVVEIDCHPERLPHVIAQLQREKPDLCFNIAEGAGTVSREAQIPALLDMLGLRYTASDAVTLAITLDKARTKEILSYHQIPTPDFFVIRSLAELDDPAMQSMSFPLMVKPLHEGSSKGIFERSLVTSRADLVCQVKEVLQEYRQPALIEAFLPGREFTVALLGNGSVVEVLPIIEIAFDLLPPGAKPVYSYEAKWVWDVPTQPIEMLRCPAPIEPLLKSEIESVCRRAYDVLRCRDWARIDVRLDSTGRAHILEVNPLPGILPNPDEHSAFPLAARAHGLNYPQLINRVVETALRRYEDEKPGS